MDSKHVVNLQGKPYPLWVGILAEAHERGLQSIETTLVQIPSEENGHVAIVKARVQMKGGEVFEGYGDASPKNVAQRMQTALLRFAETRAKGRALRDACNIGETMLEELPDEETHAASGSANGAPRTPHAAAREAGTGRGTLSAGSDPTPNAQRPTPAGFERSFSKPGTRQYSRDELLQGAAKLIIKGSQAGIQQARGHQFVDLDLDSLPNEELFALAEAIVEEMKAKKEAAA